MPSLVQSASNQGANVNTVTVTLGSNTTAGNFLAVPSGAFSTGGVPPALSTVTLGGAAGNFSNAVGVEQGASSGVRVNIWGDRNCAGGQTAVALTWATSTTEVFAYAEEWSGVQTQLGVTDRLNSGGVNSTSWSSGATQYLSQPSEVAIGVVLAQGSTGLTLTTPGAPWTELAQLSSGSVQIFGTGWQVTSNKSPLTYNGTISAAGNTAAAIATFKGLAAPNVQPPFVPRPRVRPRAYAQTVAGTVLTVVGKANVQPPFVPRPRVHPRAIVQSGIGAARAVTGTPNVQPPSVPRPRVRPRAIVQSGAGTAPPAVPVAAAPVALAGMLDRHPGYLKKRILLGI